MSAPAYREVAPPPALAAHVHCCWTFRADADAGEQVVPPDGRAELIVHLGAPCEERTDEGRWRVQPRAVFCGQLTRPLVLRARGRVRVVAVRFRPAGAWAFVGAPLDRCTDRRLDLASLHGDAEAERLLAALERAAVTTAAAADGRCGSGGRHIGDGEVDGGGTRDHDDESDGGGTGDRDGEVDGGGTGERDDESDGSGTVDRDGESDGADDRADEALIDAVAGHVARQIERHGSRRDVAVERCVDRLHDGERPRPSLAELCALSGANARELQRRFADVVGVSPRMLGGIFRLRRVFEALRDAPLATWTERALAAGFFDHPQMAREFRRLLGRSPREWTTLGPGLAASLAAADR